MRQCLIRKKYLVPKRRLSRFTSEKQHHFPGEQQFNDDIVMGTRNFEKPLSPIEFLPGSSMNIDYWLFSSFSDLFFFFIRFSRSCSFVGRRAVGHGLPPARLKCQRQYLFNRFFFCTHLPINGRENINILVGGVITRRRSSRGS